MPKNIKCSQCKYHETFGVFSPTEGGYASHRCKADTSIKLDVINVNQLRDCPLYRSRTETAWQEVRRNIVQAIPNFIKDIIGIFKK